MKTKKMKPVRGIKIRESKEDRIFNIVVVIILTISMLIVLYPLYFVLIASISDPYAVLRGDVVLLPKKISFYSYATVLRDKRILTGYVNSLMYTFVGTAINVALTMALAFPLSRKYFSGKKPITIILLIVMYFNGGMIPTYLLVNSLHLRDTFAVMVILGAVSVFNVVIARTFLMGNIPDELEESADIDGCGKIRFFTSIVIPLSKSIISVLVLYYAVGHWNDFMRGMIYLDSQEKYPLQLVIRGILINSKLSASDLDIMDPDEAEQLRKVAEALKYSIIVVSTIPTLILYPFIQKNFVKGVMIGSVKG